MRRIEVETLERVGLVNELPLGKVLLFCSCFFLGDLPVPVMPPALQVNSSHVVPWEYWVIPLLKEQGVLKCRTTS